MRLLVSDLIRRYWGLLLIAAGSSTVPCFVRAPVATAITFCFVTTYGAILLTTMDASVGAARVCVVLPICRKNLERFIWFRHVLLFPMVFVAIQIAGALVAQALPWSNGVQFLMLVCAALMSIGTAAAFFLLAGPGLAYPRVPKNFVEGMVQGVHGVVVTLLTLLCAAIIVALVGPRPVLSGGPSLRTLNYLLDLGHLARFSPDAESRIATAVVLAAVSVGVTILSYLRTTRAIGPLVSTPLGGPKTVVAHDPNRRVEYGPRWLGRAWTWIHLAITGPASVLLLLVLAEWAFIMSMSEGRQVIESLVHSRELPMALLVMTCLALVGSCIVWMNALRTFRTLPVSHTHLTLFVLSLPCVCFAPVIPYLIIAAGVTHSFDAFQPYFSAAIAGFGAAIFGCGLFVATGLVATMLYLLIGGFLLAGLHFLSPPAGLIAATTLAGAGIHMMYRAIANSSAAYRSKLVGPDSSVYR